jgi:hypothetical protein
MLKPNTIFLFLGCIPLFFVSCVAEKPQGKIGLPDSNQRQLIKSHSYKKKATALGVLTTLGATAGGGYLGYEKPVIKTNTEGESAKPAQIPSAVVGAAVGYGITSFVNHVILRQGKRNIRVSDKGEWIRKKFGRHKQYLRSVPNGFYVIDRRVVSNFIVREMQDVEDFFSAFPNAILYDKEKVVGQAKDVLPRDKLPELLSYLPETQHASAIKQQYLRKSETLTELYESITRYPVLKEIAEQDITMKSNGFKDGLKFVKYYPNSNYKKQVLIKSMPVNLNYSQANNLKRSYGKEFELDRQDAERFSMTTSQMKGYLRAIVLTKKLKHRSEYNSFLQGYDWLNYSNRHLDLLSLYWDANLNKYKNGDLLVMDIGNFGKSWKGRVSSNQVQSLILNKLKAEAKKVKIVSRNLANSTSKEWKDWKSSTGLTAGFVTEEGEMNYLLYGKIRNNSKFSLPLKVVASGDLYRVTDLSTKKGSFVDGLKKAGMIAGTLGLVIENGLEEGLKRTEMANELLNDATKKVEMVGSKSENYFVPFLPQNQTVGYSVLLDFGSGIMKTGLNYNDQFLATSELVMEDPKIEVAVHTGSVSRSTLIKQVTWEDFAVKGLPKAKAMDAYRGKILSTEEWIEIDYQRELEKARARERWERLDRETEMYSKTYDHTDGVRVSQQKTADSDRIELYIDNDDLIFEDAKNVSVTITPIGNSYYASSAKTYQQDTDIRESFYNADKVQVDISYSVDGKWQSASTVIVAPGKWNIEIND